MHGGAIRSEFGLLFTILMLIKMKKNKQVRNSYSFNLK